MSPRIVNTYDSTSDRSRSYDLEDWRDMVRWLVRHRYAWPGGYELFLVMDDGALLCWACVRENYRLIYTSDPGDGWRGVALVCDCDLEAGPPCSCDHCGRIINPEDD